MALRRHARSVSRPALALLRRRPFAAHVLANFERACDLVTPAGEVLALVSPEVGDGPLNVVLDRGFPPHALAAGMAVTMDGEVLRVGGLRIVLEGATLWEPRPDWAALRARHGASAGRCRLVAALALEEAHDSRLLSLVLSPHLPLAPSQRGGPGGREQAGPAMAALTDVFGRATAALRRGWAGDRTLLAEGATRLAGLGGGLTPAGDDFLCGAMLAAWLWHPAPEAVCGAVADAAAPRSTALSAALLRAAGRGECAADWHRLLAALAGLSSSAPPGEQGEMEAALRAVLAHGATSGADALAGFLWGALLVYRGSP